MSLADQHYQDLEQLLGLALADLDVIWRGITTADQAREALLSLLPELGDLYGTAAASLAADWYDEFREAEEVPGRFRAIAVEPALDRTDALARWAVGPLFARVPDFTTAKSLAAGGFQRLVADADRDSIIQSLDADPGAAGWSRRPNSGACDFCKGIAGRGAVYSARTADFSSHDGCGCIAVPTFGKGKKVQPYVPSQKFRTDQARAANNKRIREWLTT